VTHVEVYSFAPVPKSGHREAGEALCGVSAGAGKQRPLAEEDQRYLYYFGRWGRAVNGKLERVEGDGWKEALELYNAQRDDLMRGGSRGRKGMPG
jgi:hypothetical protein